MGQPERVAGQVFTPQGYDVAPETMRWADSLK
jgi:hypothetical protein